MRLRKVVDAYYKLQLASNESMLMDFFLAQCPFRSNYVVEHSFDYSNPCRTRLLRALGGYAASKLSFRIHINVEGITKECIICLTEAQNELFEQFVQRIRQQDINFSIEL